MTIIGEDPDRQKSLLSIVQVEFLTQPWGFPKWSNAYEWHTAEHHAIRRRHFVGRSRSRLGALGGTLLNQSLQDSPAVYGQPLEEEIKKKDTNNFERTEFKNIGWFYCHDYVSVDSQANGKLHDITATGLIPFIFTANVKISYSAVGYSKFEGLCLLDYDVLNQERTAQKYFLHREYVSHFLKAIAMGWVTVAPANNQQESGVFSGVFRFVNTSYHLGLMLQAVNPNEPKIQALLRAPRN